MFGWNNCSGYLPRRLKQMLGKGHPIDANNHDRKNLRNVHG